MASKMMSDTTMLGDDTSMMEDSSMLNEDSSILESESELNSELTTEEEKDSVLENKTEDEDKEEDSELKDGEDKEEESEEPEIGEENLYSDIKSLETSTDKLSKVTPLLALESILNDNASALNKTAVKLLMKAIKVTEEDMDVKLSDVIPSEEALMDDLNKELALESTVEKIRHYVLDVVNDVATVIKSCGFSTIEAADTRNVSLYNSKLRNVIADIKDNLPTLNTEGSQALATYIVKEAYKVAYGEDFGSSVTRAYKDVDNSIENIEIINETLDNWSTIAKHINIASSSLKMALEEDLTDDVSLEAISGRIEAIVHMQGNTINDLTMSALEKLNVGDAVDIELPPGKTFTFNTVADVTQGFYIPENLGLIELDHITKINNLEESLSDEEKLDQSKALTYFINHVNRLAEEVMTELPVDIISTSFGTIATTVINSSNDIRDCIDKIVKHANAGKTDEEATGFNDVANDLVTIYSLASKSLVILALFGYVFENNMGVINRDIEISKTIVEKITEKLNKG